MNRRNPPRSLHMDSEDVKRLENFKLSGKEEVGVEIDLKDIKISEKLCTKNLVGGIFGDNAANYTGLKQTMTNLWREKGELKIIELNNTMYQFVFLQDEERKRVLDKWPWTFDNQMLVFHHWRKDIENDTKAFLSTQIWVHTWQIPVQWLSVATVCKLG